MSDSFFFRITAVDGWNRFLHLNFTYHNFRHFFVRKYAFFQFFFNNNINVNNTNKIRTKMFTTGFQSATKRK